MKRLRKGAPAVYLTVFCLVQLIVLARVREMSVIVAATGISVLAAVLYGLCSFIVKSTRCKAVLGFISGLILAASLGAVAACISGYAVRAPGERLLGRYGTDAAGEDIRIAARIDEAVSVGENYGIYDITVITAAGENTNETLGAYPMARLTCFGSDPLSKGDIAVFDGGFSLPERYTEDGFAEGRYLESRGIFAVCSAKSEIRVLGRQREGLFSRLRESMAKGLSHYIGDSDAAGLALCLLLGKRDSVSDAVTDTFRASGASHILSVSGMHLSILFWVIAFILRLGSRRNRRFPTAEPISCIIAFAYMAVADFTPSIARAGLMLIIANVFSLCVYYIRKLSPDDISPALLSQFEDDTLTETFGSLNSLAGSVAIISLVSPYSLYDVGLQLSVLSTLGIIVAIPLTVRIQKAVPLPLDLLLSSVVITLFAVAFTFPVSVYSFGTLSTVSAASNLLLAPIITPLLVLLLFTALLALISSSGITAAICGVLGGISELLCKACIDICDHLGRLELSVIEVGVGTVLAIFGAVFAFTVSAAFITRALDLKRVSVILGLSTVILYVVFFGISFASAYRARSQVEVRLHTVSQNPYFCAATRDKRIFIDCARGYYSSKHISDTSGEALYKTENYYVLSPCRDTDFEIAYMNASLIASELEISAVLLPSPTVVSLQGHNASEYAKLTKALYDDGIEVAFYEQDLTVCGIDLIAEADGSGSCIRLGEYAVIFDTEYREEYAAAAAGDVEYCVYFCTKAKKTDNTLYTSDAQLYVTSSVHKQIDGATAIPAGKTGALTIDR